MLWFWKNHIQLCMAAAAKLDIMYVTSRIQDLSWKSKWRCLWIVSSQHLSFSTFVWLYVTVLAPFCKNPLTKSILFISFIWFHFNWMYESFACLEFVINIFKCEYTCAAKIHVSLDECYHDDDSTELCSFSKVLIDFIAWNLKTARLLHLQHF